METGGNKNSIEITFPNALRVLEWLQNEGYKVKKSSIYRHIQEGRLRRQRDATFILRDVRRYARHYLRQGALGNPQSSNRLDNLQEKRIVAETRRLEAQANMSEIKAKVIDGMYVDRFSFERALALRASTFKNDIQSWIRADAGNIVNVCGGSPEKTPDLVEFMLNSLEKFLGRYAENPALPVPTPTEAILAEDLPGEGNDEQDKDTGLDDIDLVRGFDG